MEIATVALALIESIIAMVKQSRDASAETSAEVLARLTSAQAALQAASDEAHAELGELEKEAGQ
jgi:hypothetical protein